MVVSLTTVYATHLSSTILATVSLHFSFEPTFDPPITTVEFSLDFALSLAIIHRPTTLVSEFLSFLPPSLPIVSSLVQLIMLLLSQLLNLVVLCLGLFIESPPLRLLSDFQLLLP